MLDLTTIKRPKSGPGSKASISRHQSGGGGSSTTTTTKPTPLKTSPALSKEENDRRMAANRAAGVGDDSGHSPGDPRYGTVQAPSSQFRTTGGAAEINIVEKEPVTRMQLIESLSRQQEASRSGRAYASSAYEAVVTSPARRESVKPKQTRVTVTSVRPAETPTRQSPTARLPERVKSLGGAAYQSVKLAGYIVGEPIRAAGALTEATGDVLVRQAEKNKIPRRFEKVIRFHTTTVAKGIRGAGSFVKGVGEAYTQTPGRALAYGAAFAGISYVLQPVSIGVQAVSSKLPKLIPTSVKTKTTQVLAAGVVGAYGYFAGKRILASPERARTAGRIVGAELVPAVAGSVVGEAAFLRTQGLVRSIGARFVPAEKLTPSNVLSGKTNFPTAPPRTHMQVFKEGKYSLRPGMTTQKVGFMRAEIVKAPRKNLFGAKAGVDVGEVGGRFTVTRTTDAGNVFYPHATPALFGRKFTTQAGARPKEAAGMFISGKGASVYFLRIGSAKATYYPKTILPEAVTPTLVYVAPTSVKSLPKAVRGSYGKVEYGPSYQFFAKKATKGVAYVPGVKSEVEAVIPVNSLFRQTKEAGKLFTTVKGVRVPIKLYKPRAKISAREYYYPKEDLLIRQPRYYYPKESYNVPGSTYGLLSATSKTSKPKSSAVSSRVSSVVSGPKSSAVSSKFSYKPSVTSMMSSVTYYPPRSSIYSPPRSPPSSPPASPPYSPPVTPPYRPPYSPPKAPPPTTPPPPIKLDLEFFGGRPRVKRSKYLRRPFKYQASISGVVRRLKGKSGKAGIRARGIPNV